MIPKVEEVRSKTEFLSLREFEVLDQREIPVLLEGATVNVASQIAESGGTRHIRICGAPDRVSVQRWREVGRVQVPVPDAVAEATR